MAILMTKPSSDDLYLVSQYHSSGGQGWQGWQGWQG